MSILTITEEGQLRQLKNLETFGQLETDCQKDSVTCQDKDEYRRRR